MSYYQAIGETDELTERREARLDSHLELERQRLGLDRQRLATESKGEFWNAVQAIATVTIPLAAIFGLQRYLTLEKPDA